MANLEFEQTLWQQGFHNIAGVDEAGRGPLAGPVVAAAVIFPRDCVIDGVNDSKKLSAKQRDLLFDQIYAQALAIGVGLVDHTEIDRINILQATMLAMKHALEQLRVPPEYVLVDGNYFTHKAYRYKTIIEGDAKSFTIAAASIIAKVTRDRLMLELDAHYPEYGFAKHKGYGTKQHCEAIQQFGLCEIHRRTFTRKFTHNS